LTAAGKEQYPSNNEKHRANRAGYWSKTKVVVSYVISLLNNISPFLTAAATVLLVWVAVWQWDTLEKTDQTNREINRAFVKGKTLAVSDDGLNVMFTAILENTGNTQAKNMEVFFTEDFRLDEINMPPAPGRKIPSYAPADPDIAYMQKRKELPAFSRIPLGAHATTVAGGYGPTHAFLDKMAANRADGYISGIIWYNDLFPKSARHKSKFCFVIQPTKVADHPVTTNFGLCHYWNCADDECEKHKEDYDAATAGLSQLP
jgi:hypothetical protein